MTSRWTRLFPPFSRQFFRRSKMMSLSMTIQQTTSHVTWKRKKEKWKPWVNKTQLLSYFVDMKWNDDQWGQECEKTFRFFGRFWHLQVSNVTQCTVRCDTQEIRFPVAEVVQMSGKLSQWSLSTKYFLTQFINNLYNTKIWDQLKGKKGLKGGNELRYYLISNQNKKVKVFLSYYFYLLLFKTSYLIATIIQGL